MFSGRSAEEWEALPSIRAGEMKRWKAFHVFGKATRRVGTRSIYSGRRDEKMEDVPCFREGEPKSWSAFHLFGPARRRDGRRSMFSGRRPEELEALPPIRAGEMKRWKTSHVFGKVSRRAASCSMLSGADFHEIWRCLKKDLRPMQEIGSFQRYISRGRKKTATFSLPELRPLLFHVARKGQAR
jgi:hypothetical protein